MRGTYIFYIALIFMVVSVMYLAGAVGPSGATVTPISNQSAPEASPDGVPAVAGNVTELNIFGYTTTQSWQGYYGNVTGTIQLADGSDNVLYNWSLASPEGEVYASNSSSITWGSIACMGNTNDLETSFGIASDDVDGINETFNLNNHAEFYTNSVQFSTGACNNTKLFNNAGVGTFDEVLLTDGTHTVFAALLQEDVVGFDSATHDFEMLVLENGHNGDTSVTTYYFWVELE